MFKLKILYLIIFIGVIITAKTFAQTKPEMLPEGDFEGLQRAQTEKAVEPKIELYQLNGIGAFQDSIKIDTLLENFHLYHPAFKNAVSVSYLGNYGLPYLNNDFF